MKLSVNKKIIFTLAVTIFLFTFLIANVKAAPGANFKLEIISNCGNNIVNQGEECDGLNLNGQTCRSINFHGGGVLTCRANCTFNTYGCIVGDSGHGSIYDNPHAIASFNGFAYPKSIVTILKDGQIVATTTADNDANFQVDLTGLSGGNYSFSFYSEDNSGLRSTLLNISTYLSGGTVTNAENIFITPTIKIDKSEVKEGRNIQISGQTYPNSKVLFINDAKDNAVGEVTADSLGVYSFSLNTAGLGLGQHSIKVRSKINDVLSSDSMAIEFNIGKSDVYLKPSDVFILKGDVNNDGKVNLVDFSITAFWYKKKLSNDFQIIEAERFNSDGQINLIDFSILAFYWTG